MEVTTERLGSGPGVMRVTLARPARLNAVTFALRARLRAALAAAEADAGIKAVVLAGAGRAFCAGQDLDEAAALTPEALPAWLDDQHATYAALRDMTKPVVAALHGAAVGAGLQLALCADLRVGWAGTRLGQPELKAGLASIMGSFLLSLHVGEGLNRRLSLTGEIIDGAEARHHGLLTHWAGSAEETQTRAVALAAEMAALPAAPMRASKRRLRALSQPGFETAWAAAAQAQLEAFASGAPQAARAAARAARGG